MTRRTSLMGLVGGLVALAVVLGSGPASGQAGKLQLGVLPNLSARIILTHYQPMRDYLERELKRAVEVSTAPDFKTFYHRTQAGEYDVVVTAAHFARLAQLEAGYQPLLSYRPAIRGLLVVAKDRPFSSVEQIRGKPLAFANPQSLLAMKGLQWLADANLRPGADFQVVNARNEDSLGQMVVGGEAVAAMLSTGEYRQVPEQHKAKINIFTSFGEVPSFTMLANGKLPAADASALRAAFARFEASEDGKKFFAASGFEGFAEVKGGELSALDPFLQETRKMMGPRPN
ncbi:MAG: phosphate/phosphite/phosphonate ABC transporter substrate-binding protein [Candidatus Rokubacteria bacterium]|nr:phosphate/phosphite/phosphonate ABC transporter substrate-binding protein [Candidatus Rokubacteria bacterium]